MSGSSITARFGASVRNLRFRLGLSQEELAERADLHRTYVAGIEGGARNITLKSIDKLARALEVSTATLLSHGEESAGRPEIPAPTLLVRELLDVLLVEDNPDDVELALRALKQARFANHVEVIRDGAEALDYVFGQSAHTNQPPAGHPLLMLLDLDLPKVRGEEVLRRMKADTRTQTIPVIVLTVSRKERDIAECRRLGADAYLAKPVDVHRLIEVTPDLSLSWALCRSRAGGAEC